jgi:hypothetical protein
MVFLPFSVTSLRLTNHLNVQLPDQLMKSPDD